MQPIYMIIIYYWDNKLKKVLKAEQQKNNIGLMSLP